MDADYFLSEAASNAEWHRVYFFRDGNHRLTSELWLGEVARVHLVFLITYQRRRGQRRTLYYIVKCTLSVHIQWRAFGSSRFSANRSYWRGSE